MLAKFSSYSWVTTDSSRLWLLVQVPSLLLLSDLKPPMHTQEDIRWLPKIRLSAIAKQDYFHVFTLKFFKYLFSLP